MNTGTAVTVRKLADQSRNITGRDGLAYDGVTQVFINHTFHGVIPG
ncbi:MAG: hypothetical protein AAB424_01370 [Patescibacteria group bacterium]